LAILRGQDICDIRDNRDLRVPFPVLETARFLCFSSFSANYKKISKKW